MDKVCLKLVSVRLCACPNARKYEGGGREERGREGGSRLSVNIRRGRGREEERMMGG